MGLNRRLFSKIITLETERWNYSGSGPGSYNITELAEPIDCQTYNIELGGEYAANGWSVGLKYNGSIFNDLTSNIVWDNPMEPIGCRDGAAGPPQP